MSIFYYGSACPILFLTQDGFSCFSYDMSCTCMYNMHSSILHVHIHVCVLVGIFQISLKACKSILLALLDNL